MWSLPTAAAKASNNASHSSTRRHAPIPLLHQSSPLSFHLWQTNRLRYKRGWLGLLSFMRTFWLHPRPDAQQAVVDLLIATFHRVIMAQDNARVPGTVLFSLANGTATWYSKARFSFSDSLRGDGRGRSVGGDLPSFISASILHQGIN